MPLDHPVRSDSGKAGVVHSPPDVACFGAHYGAHVLFRRSHRPSSSGTRWHTGDAGARDCRGGRLGPGSCDTGQRVAFCRGLSVGVARSQEEDGAGGGGRTLTRGEPHGILNPARLPIPPLRRLLRTTAQLNPFIRDCQLRQEPWLRAASAGGLCNLLHGLAAPFAQLAGVMLLGSARAGSASGQVLGQHGTAPCPLGRRRERAAAPIAGEDPGIHVGTLYRKIRALGIEAPDSAGRGRRRQ